MSDKVIGVVKEERLEYDANGEAFPLTEVYVKIKAAFRQKALALLKGPKLSCFLCLGLHVDGEGEAYPSIDTIVRETGYSRPTVCSALEELVKLGFIEKKRRKGETTLYTVKGYFWYGSEPRPTLLDEAQSKVALLSPSESKASERSPTERLVPLPKDKPSSKDKPPVKDNISAPQNLEETGDGQNTSVNQDQTVAVSNKDAPDGAEGGEKASKSEGTIEGGGLQGVVVKDRRPRQKGGNDGDIALNSRHIVDPSHADAAGSIGAGRETRKPWIKTPLPPNSEGGRYLQRRCGWWKGFKGKDQQREFERLERQLTLAGFMKVIDDLLEEGEYHHDVAESVIQRAKTAETPQEEEKNDWLDWPETPDIPTSEWLEW